MDSPDIQDPTLSVEVLDAMADRHPEEVKAWVQRHPAHLMSYLGRPAGLSVQPFHRAALNDDLTRPETFWLAPRGSGKTTAKLFTCAWLCVADPEVYTKGGLPYLFEKAPRIIGPHNIRVVLTSNSAENAIQQVYQVKQWLLDERMAKLFGPLDGQRWKEERSDTRLRNVNMREGTLTAMGLGSKVTGGHYDAGLLDDWVTEDNSRTEAQRRKLETFYTMTVRPTFEPWARKMGSGTRYHPMDFYEKMLDWVKAGTWQHLRRTPALVHGKDGQEVSYWPEVFPVAELHRIRQEIGEVAFSTQYQNVVDVLMGDFFEREWLENYTCWDGLSEAKRRAARTVIACDPAIRGGPRNDFTVFVVLSWVDGKFYVRRVVRGQWTDEGIKRRALMLCKGYDAELLGIEVVGGIEWLADQLSRADTGRASVKKLRPRQFHGKDKVGRASHVRRLFERGQVFLEEPTERNGISRLVYEMMAFPSSSSVPGMDDCVDALVWALILIMRGRGRAYRLHSRRGI